MLQNKETILRFGFQAGGRMDDTQQLLELCDFKWKFPERKDFTRVRNFPLLLWSLRNRDVPLFVEAGRVQMGVVGDDTLKESGADVIDLMGLGYAGCRLTLGIAERLGTVDPKDLNNRVVATSFPQQAQAYFAEENIDARLLVMNGKVESAVALEEADACIDITSTGESMEANDIIAVKTIYESEARLVANRALKDVPRAEPIVEELLMRMKASLRPLNYRYLAMNVPSHLRDIVLKILPQDSSPTMSVLANGDLDIQKVVKKKEYWNIVNALRDTGVRSIEELKIVRSIPDKDDPEMVAMKAKIFG